MENRHQPSFDTFALTEKALDHPDGGQLNP